LVVLDSQFWKGLIRAKEDSWAKIISRWAMNLIEDFGRILGLGMIPSRQAIPQIIQHYTPKTSSGG
jgi:hypothetical protein